MYLAQKYKNLVKIEVIGETFEKRPLESYFLSTDFDHFEKRPKVLFTGLHHARELLTVHMTIKIFL